ncbi:type II secretion system F family protein [Gordonia alkaliphila]|uniref:Type II secretion system F family protein n=1 Tax=Gordonia alkaliphila TaxID=1053547 RepID=A0ABP8YZL8_9ACTN|nr:type II secretion system F family protein [Gordonia alkaliphila]MCK0439278.1 type II secretion system F family protein [Gordonia alkaliphila]
MSAAIGLVALALLLWPGPGAALRRVVPCAPDGDQRSMFHGEPRWLGRRRSAPDPFAVAAGYDLFAVCLKAGLPVATAATVAAEHSPEPLGGALAHAAELLALGADPGQAWARDELTGGADPGEHFRELATLARRASRAGSSLADGVAALAEATREQAQTQALARAERAGVTISGPLGLCFLPAFVCLGIVPVVIGLASGMLGQW